MHFLLDHSCNLCPICVFHFFFTRCTFSSTGLHFFKVQLPHESSATLVQYVFLYFYVSLYFSSHHSCNVFSRKCATSSPGNVQPCSYIYILYYCSIYISPKKYAPNCTFHKKCATSTGYELHHFSRNVQHQSVSIIFAIFSENVQFPRNVQLQQDTSSTFFHEMCRSNRFFHNICTFLEKCAPSTDIWYNFLYKKLSVSTVFYKSWTFSRKGAICNPCSLWFYFFIKVCNSNQFFVTTAHFLQYMQILPVFNMSCVLSQEICNFRYIQYNLHLFLKYVNYNEIFQHEM